MGKDWIWIAVGIAAAFLILKGKDIFPKLQNNTSSITMPQDLHMGATDNNLKAIIDNTKIGSRWTMINPKIPARARKL